MSINLADLQTFITLAAGIVSLGATLLLWRMRSEFLTRKEAEKLEERLDLVEAGLAEVRVRMENMPDHDDLHSLRDAVARIDKSVAVVAEQITGLRSVLEPFGEHLTHLIHYHMKERS